MAADRRKNWIQRRIAYLRLGEDPLGEAATSAPEVIRLEGEGAPVRIFVGTSPDLYRATRVLIWSLMQVRDPGRAYELHLMANLKGVPRKGWRTGYEGYGALVPSLAGGRALYCEATSIFTGDPAAAFDAEEGGVAMLTDPAAAQKAGLAPITDAPWREPVGSAGRGGLAKTWTDLERAANEAAFMPFTKERPTREFGELIGLYMQMHEENYFPGQRLKYHVAAVRDLIAESGAASILDYGSGKAEGYERLEGEPEDSPLRRSSLWPGVTVRCYDPGVPAFSELGDGRFDGVISTDVVEHLAPLDVHWVLDEMFSRAKKFVFVVAACYPAIKTLPDGRNAHTTLQDRKWWTDMMQIVGHAHPEIEWRIGCDDKNIFGKRTTIVSGKGAALRG